jgi:protein-S-isoprenylcysteine O-methyltransferase Ste14
MNLTALIAGTLLIIVFSWNFSIRHKRYHGIPRFFAFESIYLLILINFKVWFQDPFSLNQVFSWILLILSAYAGIAGYLLLKGKGKSSGNFENTTVLVKAGIYSLIRHPLYLSLFLLGTGAMMKDPSIPALALGTVNLVAVYFTSLIEEKEMEERFGPEYRQYIKETKMFIPFLL